GAHGDLETEPARCDGERPELAGTGDGPPPRRGAQQGTGVPGQGDCQDGSGRGQVAEGSADTCGNARLRLARVPGPAARGPEAVREGPEVIGVVVGRQNRFVGNL